MLGVCAIQQLMIRRSTIDNWRTNYAMHGLRIKYVFLYMPWTGWCECKQNKSHWKVKRFYLVTRIRFDSFPLKQTADQIKRNFFPPIHNSFCHDSHLPFLEIWFMQSTVKLDIVPYENLHKYGAKMFPLT